MVDMFLTALTCFSVYFVFEAFGMDWAVIYALSCVTAYQIGRILATDINHDPYEFVGLKKEREDA